VSEDLVAGIRAYVELRPHNRAGWIGLCPFHQEETPSFVVVRSAWHCFGCGVGGRTLAEFRMAWWIEQACGREPA
jgi:DNA primase